MLGYFDLNNAGMPAVITELLDTQGRPYEGYKAIAEPILRLLYKGYLLPLTIDANDNANEVAYASDKPHSREALMLSLLLPRVT